MDLKIKLVPFNKKKALSDIPNAVFVTETKYGEHVVRMLKVGIFSFNDQCFYHDGDKYPQADIDVIAYGTYDFNKLQQFS